MKEEGGFYGITILLSLEVKLLLYRPTTRLKKYYSNGFSQVL